LWTKTVGGLAIAMLAGVLLATVPAAPPASADDRDEARAAALAAKQERIARRLEDARRRGDAGAVAREQRRAEKVAARQARMERRQNKPKDREPRSSRHAAQNVYTKAGAGSATPSSHPEQRIGWAHQALYKLNKAYKERRITLEEIQQAEREAHRIWHEERNKQFEWIREHHPGSVDRDGDPCIPAGKNFMGC
jgi:hypothetical protein